MQAIDIDYSISLLKVGVLAIVIDFCRNLFGTGMLAIEVDCCRRLFGTHIQTCITLFGNNIQAIENKLFGMWAVDCDYDCLFGVEELERLHVKS